MSAYTKLPPRDAVVLPAGVRHCHTIGTAETREAFDNLSETDGWTLSEWQAGYGWHVQKDCRVDGRLVTVFPPTSHGQTPREVSDVRTVPPANERAA